MPVDAGEACASEVLSTFAKDVSIDAPGTQTQFHRGGTVEAYASGGARDGAGRRTQNRGDPDEDNRCRPAGYRALTPTLILDPTGGSCWPCIQIGIPNQNGDHVLFKFARLDLLSSF